MATEHFIEGKSLSDAWGKALRAVSAKGKGEIAPLIVSITGFNNNAVVETPTIRAALDKALQGAGKQSVETVASTIFPQSLWNQKDKRDQLFDRYIKILPKLRKASAKNRHGLYFERMITGGPQKHPNQLDFVISAYNSRNEVRRSMLQIGIFDPAIDVTSAAQRGFPCLQHVTFAPVNETLNVNAFYATQYMFERAYGNYLGLCRLGAFAAHEMKLKLSRVTCYAGIAMCDFGKRALQPVLQVIP